MRHCKLLFHNILILKHGKRPNKNCLAGTGSLTELSKPGDGFLWLHQQYETWSDPEHRELGSQLISRRTVEEIKGFLKIIKAVEIIPINVISTTNLTRINLTRTNLARTNRTKPNPTRVTPKRKLLLAVKIKRQKKKPKYSSQCCLLAIYQTPVLICFSY